MAIVQSEYANYQLLYSIGSNFNGSNQYIDIFDGSMPANIADTPTGNLLVRVPTSTASAAYPPGRAEIIFTDTTVTTSGTPTFWRLCDSSNNPWLMGTIGTSGTDLILNIGTLAAGGTISIPMLTIEF
jgi:hypothetical protein